MSSAFQSIIDKLSPAWQAVKNSKDLADNPVLALTYVSDSHTLYVLAKSEYGYFNAFAVGAEDGQIYEAKGADPKFMKKTGTLVPAKTLRRGKPIGTRNVFVDAEWAMKAALTTRGGFVTISSVSVAEVTA